MTRAMLHRGVWAGSGARSRVRGLSLSCRTVWAAAVGSEKSAWFIACPPYDAPEGTRTPAAVGTAQVGGARSDIAAQATVELRSVTSQVTVPEGFTS
jgi:hypothetical protein